MLSSVASKLMEILINGRLFEAQSLASDFSVAQMINLLNSKKCHLDAFSILLARLNTSLEYL